ncbi:uncharacterized protein BDR25DRAFT_36395 [Lindgomyces ingoldianus]|uniref:Uncharacterized protein n=1 Tax=Lindgomyces ingoldianus TaxID=673940 RepID=A0ACB6QUX9_9PLEO|nr:uncharacterized protein BDR25DRAFT_36395 [Lindgomyces ingoldianus]KAF2470067.1 hypothetical protein BDR25DRAFT_36395 [Lindgomyces ingoldianus]
MQVSSLLTQNLASGTRCSPGSTEAIPTIRQYNTRQNGPAHNMQPQAADITMSEVYPSTETSLAPDALSSLRSSEPKHVSFELFLPEAPQHRARLPMRVNIFPHDTTDSIITTVKNFYGLYERRGVIFQDHHGTTLIARYENFTHNMVVYVRVADEDPEMEGYSPGPRESMSPRRPRLEEPFQMLPPSNHHQQTLKLESHTAGRQSNSPQPGRGRRSASVNTNTKPRARPAPKSRGTSSHGSFADPNGDINTYSDSDGGNASVTSSRRGRKEQVASAEISLDNIVEGGRRKRAKFDSSELPLFVPPQVPMTASLSSISPQRRVSSHNGASPYYSNQQTFAYPHPLPSPQSFGQGDISWTNGLTTPYSNSSGQAQGYRSRTRGSAQYVPYRQTGNTGLVLPTPDPTIGSVISDEDVARQLMRLGDASNFSSHGRTSTSTLDDALSGKAEAASSSDESDEGSDDDEQDLPPLPYPLGRSDGINGEAAPTFDSGDTSGEEYEDNRDDSFKGESDEVIPDEHQGQQPHPLAVKARSSISSKGSKPPKSRSVSKGKGKPGGPSKQPISPASLPPQSRKASSASVNFQHQLGADEEDLSSKPRCQRCRKSKKGCDRQRPCQRCKDAGIGIEGCISEDEGNGRKGRYGRHMGVPVKKNQMDPPPTPDNSISTGVTTYTTLANGAIEKGKKRKR